MFIDESAATSEFLISDESKAAKSALYYDGITLVFTLEF